MSNTVAQEMLSIETDGLAWDPADPNFSKVLSDHPLKVAVLVDLYDRKIRQRDSAEISLKAKKAAMWEDIKKNQTEDGKALSDTRVSNRVDSDAGIALDAQDIVELTYEAKRYANIIARYGDRKELIKAYASIVSSR
jgi:hypothetical protein